MVLAAPTVLPHVPHRRRGIASSAIFAGVGLGIAMSGTLVPLLLRQGLTETWCGLGVLSFILTLIALVRLADGGRRYPRRARDAIAAAFADSPAARALC